MQTTTVDPQEQLPNVRAEHAGGQVELVHPGERKPADEEEPPRDDRTLSLFGVKPGARWRRESAEGNSRSWSQLDLQLRGIEKRKGRPEIWEEGKAAPRTMENVRAQTYNATDLGGLDCVGLPSWARRKWELTPNEEKLLGSLWAAYRDDTGGVYENQVVLASDLGFSERTMRNILNGRGGTSPRPGLIERGLVRGIETYKPGTDGRPSDDHWLLLRIGPDFEREAIALVFAKGRRPSRGSGYTRGASRKALGRARREARARRRELASVAWTRRQASKEKATVVSPRASERAERGRRTRADRRTKRALGAGAQAPTSSAAAAGVSTFSAGETPSDGHERSAGPVSSEPCRQNLTDNPAAGGGPRSSGLNPPTARGSGGASAHPRTPRRQTNSLRSWPSDGVSPAEKVDTPAAAAELVGACAPPGGRASPVPADPWQRTDWPERDQHAAPLADWARRPRPASSSSSSSAESPIGVDVDVDVDEAADGARATARAKLKQAAELLTSPATAELRAYLEQLK